MNTNPTAIADDDQALERRICDDYLAGLSRAAIAAKYNLKPTDVSPIVESLAKDPRRRISKILRKYARFTTPPDTIPDPKKVGNEIAFSKSPNILEAIALDHLNGIPAAAIARNRSLTYNHVLQLLHLLDIDVAPPGKYGLVLPPSAIADYHGGMSPHAIAKKYRIGSRNTVIAALKRQGITIRSEPPKPAKPVSKKPPKTALTLSPEDITAYRNGASLESLARKHSVQSKTIRAALKRQNVTLRSQWIFTLPREDVAAYCNGTSAYALSVKHSVHAATVIAALKRQGVTPRTN